MRIRLRATWVALLVSLSLVVVGQPAYAASGLWDRAWGTGVVTGSSSTLEICTVASQCLPGAEDAAGIGGTIGTGQGVAVDPVTGDVWVSDGDANRLQKFTADGAFLLALGKDVGGTGVDICTVSATCHYGDHGFHGEKGGQFYNPSGLTTDQARNLFVADTYNHRIQEFTAAGAFVRAWGFGAASGGANQQLEVCTTVASCTASLMGPSGLGGDLQQPYSVALDSQGGVYVGDSGRVQKFAITSEPSNVSFVSTWGWDVVAGGGTGFEICTQSAQCKQAGFGNGLGGDISDATGVAVAGSELFVANGGVHRVEVFTLDGAFQRAWGQDVVIDPEEEEHPETGFEICTVASSCKVGVAGSAPGALDLVSYWVADGISVGPAGDVYVADIGNDRIQVYGSDGAYRRTFGASGTQGGQLDTPISVEAGDEQAVYVVDRLNRRIQRFRDSSAGASTFAFGAATYTHPELPGDQIVTVTRSGDTTVRVKVHYATADGTAAAGSDYTAVSGTLRFVPGQAQQTFVVPVLGDEAPESAETVQLELSSPSYGDVLGSPSTATLTIQDDDTVDTTILTGPTGLTNQRQPTFTFSSTPPGATFECLLDSSDSGGFTACPTPFQPSSPLPDGPHFLFVRAVLGSTPDSTPARVDFIVDVTAPTTVLTVAPAAGGGAANVTAVQQDAHPGAIRCAVDGSPPATFAAMAPTACPLQVTAPGDHVAYAASVDAAGNVGPIVSSPFKVLPVPDTVIDSGPSGEVFIQNPYFGFHATVAGSKFQCRVDAASFARCTTPFVSSRLASGAHSFEVRAVGPDGATDPSPARRAFTVGAPRTVTDGCTLTGISSYLYAPDPPHGCFFGRHLDKCPSDMVCHGVNLDCPAYSRCTVTTTSTWSDSDDGSNWAVKAQALAGRLTQTPDVEFYCYTEGTHGCRVTAISSTIGDPREISSTTVWPSATCLAWFHTGSAGGRSDARRLRCDVQQRIEPAVVAQPIASGGRVQALVPGSGTVTLSSAGSSRGARAKPLVQSVTQQVSGEGVVTFKPKLAKKAKRKLKRGKKVKVKVTVTYRSPEGTVTTQTGKVVLQLPMKTPREIRRYPRLLAPLF